VSAWRVAALSALLTRAYTELKRSCSRTERARIEAWLERSAGRKLGPGPVASAATLESAWVPREVSRDTMTTSWPVAASWRAVARPIPLLAPVTSIRRGVALMTDTQPVDARVIPLTG